MSDLISRQAVINLIQEDKIKLDEPYLSIYKSTGCIKEAETQVMTCDRHIEMIKNLPSVDVEETMMRNPCKECTYYHKENNTCQSKKCATGGTGRITFLDRMFCEPMKRDCASVPNCGADMRGENK